MVPLDEIKPNPEQPRVEFDNEQIEALAESIRAHGVLAPLVVRRSEGQYVLIAGERRLRASGLAGLTEVPVVLRDVEEASVQLEIALVENLQRVDLDPIEGARGFQRLIEQYGYSQDEVARRVGKKRSTVANALRLLRLPDFVLQALRQRHIRAGHARALVSVEDVDELRRVLARVVAQKLNVRQTEQLVARLTQTPRVIRQAERARRERTFEYATKLLCESLHTSVAIRPLKKGGGRILIDYSDAEDLERLIQQLRQSTR
jgi:ParB family chromosome partitioning protein